MHTLTIRVDDSVLDKIVDFLNNLPKEDIEIIELKELDPLRYISLKELKKIDELVEKAQKEWF